MTSVPLQGSLAPQHSISGVEEAEGAEGSVNVDDKDVDDILTDLDEETLEDDAQTTVSDGGEEGSTSEVDAVQDNKNTESQSAPIDEPGVDSKGSEKEEESIVIEENGSGTVMESDKGNNHTNVQAPKHGEKVKAIEAIPEQEIPTKEGTAVVEEGSTPNESVPDELESTTEGNDAETPEVDIPTKGNNKEDQKPKLDNYKSPQIVKIPKVEEIGKRDDAGEQIEDVEEDIEESEETDLDKTAESEDESKGFEPTVPDDNKPTLEEEDHDYGDMDESNFDDLFSDESEGSVSEEYDHGEVKEGAVGEEAEEAKTEGATEGSVSEEYDHGDHEGEGEDAGKGEDTEEEVIVEGEDSEEKAIEEDTEEEDIVEGEDVGVAEEAKTEGETEGSVSEEYDHGEGEDTGVGEDSEEKDIVEGEDIEEEDIEEAEDIEEGEETTIQGDTEGSVSQEYDHEEHEGEGEDAGEKEENEEGRDIAEDTKESGFDQEFCIEDGKKRTEKQCNLETQKWCRSFKCGNKLSTKCQMKNGDNCCHRFACEEPEEPLVNIVNNLEEDTNKDKKVHDDITKGIKGGETVVHYFYRGDSNMKEVFRTHHCASAPLCMVRYI